MVVVKVVVVVTVMIVHSNGCSKYNSSTLCILVANKALLRFVARHNVHTPV